MFNLKALDEPSQAPLTRQGKDAMAKKNTYKYELHDGHKTVYIGTTIDPDRREEEHRASGKEFTKMTFWGRPSTAEGAGKWEEERIDTAWTNRSASFR